MISIELINSFDNLKITIGYTLEDLSTILGGDYMESFQPGLSFSPVNRAEIVLRLHGNIQPGVTQNCSSSEAKIFARAETKSRNEAILVYLTTKNLFLSFLHLGETVCCI